MMITRYIFPHIQKALLNNAAVVLLGARQVGKTTLAMALSAKQNCVYLDLERPSDKAKLIEPELYFSAHSDKLIILDEIQRMPEIFQTLRSQIDENRQANRKYKQFLLLGSASNELLKQTSESLAGRVVYMELTPFNLQEINFDNCNQLWVRGGFPESYLAGDNSLEWRESFIRTYLERDIPTLGVRIPSETLRRFWTMLAHNQGTLFNASQIGTSLSTKGQTVSRYLDLMVDLLLVRRLMPWFSNVKKRLVKSPKVYVRDSGILHALLGLESLDDVLGHPIVGTSWEGFVIENLLSVISSRVQAFFYRTSSGAEIDLLLVFPQEKIYAIEIKRTLRPSVSKGFRIACEDLKPEKRFFVYSGNEAYWLDRLTQAVPMATLMAFLTSI